MSDANPATSPAPTGSEAVAAGSDATVAKRSTDMNGTSANDTLVESSKEVAPEIVAKVEALEDKPTNGELVVAQDVPVDEPAMANNDDAGKKEDVKENDAAPSASDATEGPLTTPASASKGKGRRKSGGVPEHKSKKLSKKPSKARLSNVDAKPGDYFFIRLKGYPLWPGIVVDESMLPPLMCKSRPVAAMRPDGSYLEGYEDGGPKSKFRSFPVMYLFTNEFSWIPHYDLVEMHDDALQEIKPNMRKDLHEAYLIGRERKDLDYFKNILTTHLESKAEEESQKEAAKAAKEAAKEAKKSKKPRMSNAKVVEDDEDIEMADAAVEPESEEAEGVAIAKPKSKKRKNPDGETENPAQPESVKKPRPTIKLNTPKTANGTSTPKSAKDSSAPKSAKAKGKKAAKDAPASPAPKKPELSAEEKQILFLRHKLQKGLLTRDQEPKADEMKQMSEFVTKLEGYSDLEVSIIRATKINKVLKAILKLTSIPKEEEFQFKPRSQSLLDKWNKLLASETETPVASGVNGAKSDEKPELEEAKVEPSQPTNGTKESTEEKDEAPAAVETAIASVDATHIESPKEESHKEKTPEPAAVESTA
ncbi:Tudor/PWWP/MBT [Glarea lozoyensis ATCC 20868]|uniref:Tudor/PWWP/MBT n=1 Tax=Glarea lozoyensis (strain ATCC 20868 / MF5171) TaxID=1116229 RepID=S3DRZ2_GLAL2|nr:Tudor/PWWP/MBT [Glarea lozoyensis ATCC 20868]EPE29218.1 Tudor/PWWP/MBT [Glarea lozoyensis ATCC 20868]